MKRPKLSRVAAAERDRQFEVLARFSPVGIFRNDVRGRCIFVNERCSEISGLSPEKAMGESWALALHPEDRERVVREWQRSVEKQLPFTLEYRFQRPGGGVTWVLGRAVPEAGPGGVVTGFLGTITDITDQKLAEEALRSSQERLNALIANVPGAVYRSGLAPAWTTEYMSDAIFRITGYPASDFVHDRVRSFFDIIHPDDRERVERQTLAFLEKKQSYTVEYRVLCADGGIRWLEDSGQGLYSPDGNLLWLDGVVLDITDRKRAEEALRRTSERLQDVSRRLLEVQETERRSLARELHDEIGQALTAINFNLQALRTSELSEAMRKRIEDSQALVEGALHQVRNLSLDLRPTMLDDFGLVSALQWYVDQQAQRTGRRMVFRASPLDERPDAKVETACFRVVQEALTNVVRHSGAREAVVELLIDEGELQLIIRDDGAGFDPASVRRRRRGGSGFGLLGMEERVLLAGGRFDCASAPGKGTEIRARFPLAGPLPH